MERILVVGDLMIDCYIWGSCERISPEAPVGVVDVRRQSKRLGGCGNVVSNLIALGAQVGVISVVGNDAVGEETLALLRQKGVSSEWILREEGRISSQKSRVIAAHQQVLRLDSESVGDISLNAEVLEIFSRVVEDFDIVLLSDYGKGVLNSNLTPQLIGLAKLKNRRVLIDPKGADFSKYKGAFLLTPNKKEALAALNFLRTKSVVASNLTSHFVGKNGEFSFKDHDSIGVGLRVLKDSFELSESMITLSEDGIALLSQSDGEVEAAGSNASPKVLKTTEFETFPALAKEVFDVTGAGDSVLATLGVCLAKNFTLQESIKTANLAAAVVVAKVGSADATWEEIERLREEFDAKNSTQKMSNSNLDDLNIYSNQKPTQINSTQKPRPFESKILTSLPDFKSGEFKGKKIVFTNGCFDLLHFGHTSYLQKARSFGDILIVGLNSDASVRKLKGQSRPLNSQNDRAAVLASLESVDYVVIFDEETPIELIKRIRPDVLVKGADYAGKEVVGSEVAGCVKLVEFAHGRSTTELIQKALQTATPSPKPVTQKVIPSEIGNF